MLEERSIRIAMALFVVTAIALAVYQLGSSLWAAAAVIAAGTGSIIIMAYMAEPTPMRPAQESSPTGDSDAEMLGAISEPVLLVTDNRVRIANAAAQTLLGRHIIGEDIRLAIRHPAASALFAADAHDGNVELVGLGGRDVQMALHVASIASGKRIVHLIDRSARHAVEQARVDFVANASHELRTPLAAILGFIETLADEKAGGDPEVRGRFLDVMFKEARRMQRLVDDLISLSRIESEKYLLPDTTVSLTTLVREVAGELRDLQGDQANRITLDLDPDSGNVTGDRAQLSQIIHNLAGNAFKYGRQDGAIGIAVKCDEAVVRLIVTDEGDGIPAEHVPRLTERFYRVDSGRSRALGGTGLGLAIVKHIVERHRGRLEISSVVGVGTTVSISIPAAPAPTVIETSPN